MVLLLLSPLLLPAVARGELVLLAYGDSTVGNPDDTAKQWPRVLGTLRPDLRVVNAGLPGDTSGNVDRFRQALEKHSPNVVTILAGTNDPVCVPSAAVCDRARASAERTTRNLTTMAELARRRGADVYVLTPLPALWKFGALCRAAQPHSGCGAVKAMETRQTFTADVATRLLAWRPPAGVHVLDLRGHVSHRWPLLANDGLHPNPEGNRMIAAFLAARLPGDHQRDAHR
jgi:lysophospholipase L1-like esterase